MKSQRFHAWTEDPAVTRERERRRRRERREKALHEHKLRTGDGLDKLFGGRARIVRVSR